LSPPPIAGIHSNATSSPGQTITPVKTRLGQTGPCCFLEHIRTEGMRRGHRGLWSGSDGFRHRLMPSRWPRRLSDRLTQKPFACGPNR
jgi:hypothetical protein